jgi:alkanesulfonate monooxygenase SsuD/methylene tetrahydromethanopterin reductase-like flavin-dependent oxidoreductase (luciferase family)
MTLKIGWWDHFEQQRGIPLAQQYDERLKLLKLADSYGFYGYHVAEHHFTPLDMAPSPLMFLTAAARETKTIRLGSLVLVLPLYNPVRLIQELCMVDHLSHGRLMPGVGRGVRDVEHEWFGHQQEEARPRFEETFAILREALTKDRLTFKGKFYSFDNVPTNFTTHQKPLRFWYAGNIKSAMDGGLNVIGVGNREAYDLYAETFAAKRKAGDPLYQGDEGIAGSTRRIIIAETDEKARALAERAWPAYQANFRATDLRVGGRAGPPARDEPDGDYAASAERGGVAFGSASTVKDILLKYLDRLGPNHTYFAPAFQWGDITHDEAKRTMEMFVSDVMPALKAAHERVPA